MRWSIDTELCLSQVCEADNPQLQWRCDCAHGSRHGWQTNANSRQSTDGSMQTCLRLRIRCRRRDVRHHPRITLLSIKDVDRGRTYESIGIENATPESIREALKCTRTFDKDAEKQFMFETLYDMGLVQTPSEQVRRRRCPVARHGDGLDRGCEIEKALHLWIFGNWLLRWSSVDAATQWVPIRHCLSCFLSALCVGIDSRWRNLSQPLRRQTCCSRSGNGIRGDYRKTTTV